MWNTLLSAPREELVKNQQTTLQVQSKLKLLKLVLKQKKMTLKTLAAKIQMSESGLKKLFLGKDIGLLRLYEICAALEISLDDLFRAEADDRYFLVKFPEEVQRFFMKNFIYFQFYWLLVYERYPIDQVQKKLKISNELRLKVLFKLNSFEMIELMPGNRIKIPDPTRIRWANEGPLVKYLYREWTAKLIREVLQNENSSNFFQFRYLQMTEETHQELLQKMKSLEDEFVKRGIREMKMMPKELVPCRWLMVADSATFFQPLETPDAE